MNICTTGGTLQDYQRIFSNSLYIESYNLSTTVGKIGENFFLAWTFVDLVSEGGGVVSGSTWMLSLRQLIVVCVSASCGLFHF